MRMKRGNKKFKIIGATLILIGCVFILNSFSTITGFAIADSIGKGVSSIIGLVLVGGGIVMFMNSLEGTIQIYQYPNSEGDESYYLDDPKNLFGNTGIVDFQDFLKEARKIRNDPELLSYAKKHYGIPFINLVDKRGKYSNIARRCLEALDIEYIEEEEENKRNLNSEIDIVRSREFEKSSKRAPKKFVEEAIAKIETGLADMHNLKGNRSGTKAINVTKGGRIIYKQKGNIVTLIDYLPSHDY